MAKELQFHKASKTNMTFQSACAQGLEDGWIAIRQTYCRLTKGWYRPKFRKPNGDFRVVAPQTPQAEAVLIHKKHGYRWALWRIRQYLSEITSVDGSKRYESVTPIYKIISQNKKYVYYFFYTREVKKVKQAGA